MLKVLLVLVGTMDLQSKKSTKSVASCHLHFRHDTLSMNSICMASEGLIDSDSFCYDTHDIEACMHGGSSSVKVRSDR